ncbi:MAG: pectin acetylesterase-family hydrolase [bacterium]
MDWEIIRPGGDTICSRGTEYAYAVRGGTVNKVVIDFMGGGACWDDFTCSVADAIFASEVNPEALLRAGGQGIYDRDNPENPFKDWYHVFIPYCTGDIHWGNNVETYGDGEDAFQINHKGAVNAGAVMDWIYENFERPERILVTGCSAGAYGSVGWAPYVMDHYGDSEVVQVGDSGAGVITEDFFQNSFPSWNAFEHSPRFIPGLDPDKNDLYSVDLAYMYGQIGSYFPQFKVGQYNTMFDNNQTFYYQAMGGENGAEGWSEGMNAMVASSHDQAENFYSYTASGEQHCIIVSDNFYNVQEDGVRLVDWFQDLAEGKDVDQRVTCNDCDRATGTPEN